MNRTKLLIPLLLSLILIASCNLTKDTLVGRGGNSGGGSGGGSGEDNLIDLPKPIFDEKDYDPKSPLYKKTITGVGSGNNKLFISTETGGLWQKDLTRSLSRTSNPWLDLSNTLPAPFTKAIVITELAGGAQGFAYLALTNEAENEAGLYSFTYSTKSFGLVGTMPNQKPLKFLEINTDSSHTLIILLYTISSTGSGEKFLYDTGWNEVTPRDANKNRPGANQEILGNFDLNQAFLVSTKNNGKETYEIWYNTGQKPIPIQVGENVTIASHFKIKGQDQSAIVTASGTIYPIDTKTGFVDEANKILGMGTRLDPTSLRYIDQNPVATSHFGYFEIKNDERLIHPTASTTDSASYGKNGLKNIKILGIRALANKKIYMRTEKNGLWERDPLTKAWTGV